MQLQLQSSTELEEFGIPAEQLNLITAPTQLSPGRQVITFNQESEDMPVRLLPVPSEQVSRKA